MKSIEEMSIEDLLYRVRYSILPCYGQEILSRFAGKDTRIAELEKLPQIKYIYGLITKIAELEKENERLILKNNWYHEEHAKEMNKRIELEKYRMFFEIWQKKI